MKIGPKNVSFSRNAKKVLGWCVCGGGGVKWVGRDTANIFFFYGRPNGSSVRIKIPSLGIIRIGYSLSLLGYANVSASIVSLKRLIVSKTFLDTCLMTKPTKWFVRQRRLRSVWASAVRTNKAWFLSYPLSAKPRPMINVILQFLELDLDNVNVSAKFYQNIPNGFRVKFHCFQNLNLGKTSTNPKCHLTISWATSCQNQCVCKISSQYSTQFKR